MGAESLTATLKHALKPAQTKRLTSVRSHLSSSTHGEEKDSKLIVLGRDTQHIISHTSLLLKADGPPDTSLLRSQLSQTKTYTSASPHDLCIRHTQQQDFQHTELTADISYTAPRTHFTQKTHSSLVTVIHPLQAPQAEKYTSAGRHLLRTRHCQQRHFNVPTSALTQPTLRRTLLHQ